MFLQMKKANNERERLQLRKRALDFLERYISLILFNAFLHSERRAKHKITYADWLAEVTRDLSYCKIIVIKLVTRIPEIRTYTHKWYRK